MARPEDGGTTGSGAAERDVNGLASAAAGAVATGAAGVGGARSWDAHGPEDDDLAYLGVDDHDDPVPDDRSWRSRDDDTPAGESDRADVRSDPDRHDGRPDASAASGSSTDAATGAASEMVPGTATGFDGGGDALDVPTAPTAREETDPSEVDESLEFDDGLTGPERDPGSDSGVAPESAARDEPVTTQEPPPPARPPLNFAPSAAARRTANGPTWFSPSASSGATAGVAAPAPDDDEVASDANPGQAPDAGPAATDDANADAAAAMAWPTLEPSTVEADGEEDEPGEPVPVTDEPAAENWDWSGDETADESRSPAPGGSPIGTNAEPIAAGPGTIRWGADTDIGDPPGLYDDESPAPGTAPPLPGPEASTRISRWRQFTRPRTGDGDDGGSTP